LETTQAPNLLHIMSIQQLLESLLSKSVPQIMQSLQSWDSTSVLRKEYLLHILSLLKSWNQPRLSTILRKFHLSPVNLVP